MKENLKLGLLGVVTVLTLINSYFIFTSDKHNSDKLPVSANTGNTGNNQAIDNPALPSSNNPVQQNPNDPAPLNVSPTKISFDKYEHDYGTVYKQTDNEYEFTFKNTGKEPLIIQNAKGSCGCTVPEWPKEPIAPGESSSIKVVYSSRNSEGHTSKKVTVTANTEPRNTELIIKANVVDQPNS